MVKENPTLTEQGVSLAPGDSTTSVTAQRLLTNVHTLLNKSDDLFLDYFLTVIAPMETWLSPAVVYATISLPEYTARSIIYKVRRWRCAFFFDGLCASPPNCWTELLWCTFKLSSNVPTEVGSILQIKRQLFLMRCTVGHMMVTSYF